jgi:mono/diheme cytochrome c family protein
MIPSRQLRALALRLLLLAQLAQPAAAGADDAQARRLLNALGCKACHHLQGQGGSVGPSLDSWPRGQDAQSLLHRLQRPPGASGRMPAFDHRPEEELKILADFLAGAPSPGP